MKLTTEDGTTIRKPDSSQLKAALDRLGLPGNGFAILDAGRQRYVQVAGSRADGYVVEYREGSEDKHYSSTVTDMPHAQMVALLDGYLNGSEWKRMVAWRRGFGRRPASRPAPSKGSKVFLGLFFGAGVAALILSGYLAFDRHQFLQRALLVDGHVVRLTGRDTYRAVVEYSDHLGQRHTLESTVGSHPAAYVEGEQVKVAYDPEDPAYLYNARIVGFQELWFGSVMALIFGIGFSGIPLAHWLLRRRKGKPARR
ncbi:DUF3592 domain-containing protein [Piscinibacter terrae]|nr:DUF3592 domain-containing protein [Albitalea terrae]